MTSKSWKVVGSGSDTRIMECRRHKDGNQELLTYDEAKERALRLLENDIRPYVTRIEELERDEFEERGKLPAFKAWRSDLYLVVAKTKKRAMEIVWATRSYFNDTFQQADGDWWYRYAQDESIWIEIKTEQGSGTGEFQRALLRDEAEAMVREELASFETIPLEQLKAMVGRDEVRERVCSKGLPVILRLEVRRSDWEHHVVSVEGRIEKRVVRPVSHYVRREM